MDGDRFDHLSRTLAAGVSRRKMVAGAGLALLGALGGRRAPAASAQVTQAQCGNVTCAKNPGRCNDGCVCCGYGNGNSRCRPAGQCGPGEVLCPPGLTFCPESGQCAACCGNGDCGAGTLCCGGTCVAGSLDDPTSCGCGGERCPLNEYCAGGICICDPAGSSSAPFTCQQGGGAFCSVSDPGNLYWNLADTGEFSFVVPAGYFPCVGTDCKIACPDGTTCEPEGFCRR